MLKTTIQFSYFSVCHVLFEFEWPDHSVAGKKRKTQCQRIKFEGVSRGSNRRAHGWPGAGRDWRGANWNRAFALRRLVRLFVDEVHQETYLALAALAHAPGAVLVGSRSVWSQPAIPRRLRSALVSTRHETATGAIWANPGRRFFADAEISTGRFMLRHQEISIESIVKVLFMSCYIYIIIQ